MTRHQRTPVAERFWPKVKKTDECWLWTACLTQSGYGQIGIGRKVFTASRISYEMEFGEIPEGMHVLHRCDNPACVRPDHLFLGTQADNMRDMTKKGRGKQMGGGRKGEANGNHRLTTADVIEIKAGIAAGKSQRGMAKMYGVSKTLIYLIKLGKTWAHIEGA